MTDVVLDPDETPAPETWLEEVCDALHMKRAGSGRVRRRS